MFGLGAGEILIILVIALVYAPRTARLARAAALDIVVRDYVAVARLRGDPAWLVVWREILPNSMGSLFVEFSLRAGYAPVLVGSLGFLGFGLRPPTPEWGLMISENRALLIVTPITVLGPGLAQQELRDEGRPMSGPAAAAKEEARGTHGSSMPRCGGPVEPVAGRGHDADASRRSRTWPVVTTRASGTR